jgi:hypothetical protein
MRLHYLRLRGITEAFPNEVCVDFDGLGTGLIAIVGENGAGSRCSSRARIRKCPLRCSVRPVPNRCAATSNGTGNHAIWAWWRKSRRS